MSALTPSELLQASNTAYYFTAISTTLLFHEFCLTLTREVERFWSPKKLSWAVALFFLNRYLTLFGHVPVLVEYFWYSTSPNKTVICHGLQSYYQYFAMVIELVVVAMFIMRTFALYERSRPVLTLLLAIAFVGTGFACWCIISGKESGYMSVDYFVYLGCPPAVSRSQALRYAGAWGGMLVFDALVFGLTAYKSLSHYRTIIPGPSLSSLMLRDGAMYFGIIVLLTIANILTFVYGGPFNRGLLTSLTNVFSSTTITWLMLNLRDPRLRIPQISQPTLTRISFREPVASASANAQAKLESRGTDHGINVESVPNSCAQ